MLRLLLFSKVPTVCGLPGRAPFFFLSNADEREEGRFLKIFSADINTNLEKV